MVHEGPATLVEAEVAAMHAIASELGAETLPGQIAEHWMGHRNNVNPWDQIFARNMVADTVEVSAAWDRIGGIYDAATAAVAAIPGCRASSAHSSHVYRSGLNLYFTFAIERADTGEMEGAYFDAWSAIMEATRAGGGSLSHHHGIGRVRRPWIADELGQEGAAVLRRLKAAFDPAGVMNPGVLIPDA